jgi:hypothetical protein
MILSRNILTDSRIDKTDSCHIWTGPKDSDGYGDFRNAKKYGISRKVHRAVWEAVNGPIPKGLSVCHHCDNRACVNPAHLFLGTQRDNNADMLRNQRHAKGERNGMARLTLTDVAQIRERYAAGSLQRELAEQFGCHKANISLIVRNENWTN